MIDIESKVVDSIFNAVTTEYPDADITTGFDEKTAKFPCVVVEEKNNFDYQKTATDDCSENHAKLIYEVSVYTNNVDDAKTVGKKILNIVDETLKSLKFRRVRKNQPLNIARTIFRQYGRWDVVVSQPVVSGEDTIYYLYRR